MRGTWLRALLRSHPPPPVVVLTRMREPGASGSSLPEDPWHALSHGGRLALPAGVPARVVGVPCTSRSLGLSDLRTLTTRGQSAHRRGECDHRNEVEVTDTVVVVAATNEPATRRSRTHPRSTSRAASAETASGSATTTGGNGQSPRRTLRPDDWSPRPGPPRSPSEPPAATGTTERGIEPRWHRFVAHRTVVANR